MQKLEYPLLTSQKGEEKDMKKKSLSQLYSNFFFENGLTTLSWKEQDIGLDPSRKSLALYSACKTEAFVDCAKDSQYILYFWMKSSNCVSERKVI